jgi:aspartate kinase
MGIVVQKFGGSSVANPERIKRVAQRVITEYKKGNSIAVVVSALGDTTDELIRLAKQISKIPPKREMDMLLATGEQVSIALLAMAIIEEGYPAISLTGQQVGIITDSMHTKAKIININQQRIMEEFTKGNIVIVAGFQGVNEFNDITTLGRGGSDTTAVAIAAALNADLCEIYTDVDGVYTADPRVIKNAKKLQEISYDEMLELASLGAGVLQSRSVECAKLHGVELCVRSSFNNNDGTYVKEESKLEKKVLVRGVAKDTNVAKIAILEVPDTPGIAYRVFNALAEEGINIDMIIQSINTDKFNDILFTINQDDLDRTLLITERLVAEIKAGGFVYDTEVAKISIVGAGIASNPGIAARMFEAFAEKSINIQAISTSELKISCLISEKMAIEAMQVVHDKFALSNEGTYELPIK